MMKREPVTSGFTEKPLRRRISDIREIDHLLGPIGKKIIER